MSNEDLVNHALNLCDSDEESAVAEAQALVYLPSGRNEVLAGEEVEVHLLP